MKTVRYRCDFHPKRAAVKRIQWGNVPADPPEIAFFDDDNPRYPLSGFDLCEPCWWNLRVLKTQFSITGTASLGD